MDLALSAGRSVVFALRWNPSNISIEVQGGGIDSRSRSVAISHGDVAQPEMLLRHVAEGEDAVVDLASRPPATASWCVGLVFLTRRGAPKADRDTFARAVSREAGELFQEFIASTGIADIENGALVAFPGQTLHVDVDDERLECWARGLDRPPGWGGECELVFMRYPLSHATLTSALGVVAYSFAKELDRVAGSCAHLPPVVPRVFVDERDAWEWFWYHACAGHFMVDETAALLKEELQKRVSLREQEEKRVVLPAGQLASLFDAAGRDWLAAKVARLRKKRSSREVGLSRLIRAGWPNKVRNATVDAFLAFRGDRAVAARPESGGLMDLWMSGAKLARDVGEIRSRALPDALGVVREYLRVEDDRAPKFEFEIEVMADLLRAGHSAKFVPVADQEARRTPDIRIDGFAREVYVECSRKDPEPEHEKVAQNIAQSLMESLSAQGLKRQRSFLLELEFDDAPRRAHVEAILNFVKTRAAGVLPASSSSVHSAEWRVTLRELGDWGRVWRLGSLYGVVADASWVYATGAWNEGWSVRDRCRRSAEGIAGSQRCVMQPGIEVGSPRADATGSRQSPPAWSEPSGVGGAARGGPKVVA